MRLLALMPFAVLMVVAGCDDGNPTDALDARIEEEKKIAVERRKKDDPTTFATDEPEGIKLGLELLDDKAMRKEK